jgi:hypothetical protein
MTEPAELLVGDLFDPDDLLAQWVFALTSTTADLGVAEGMFRDASQSDEPGARTLYVDVHRLYHDISEA